VPAQVSSSPVLDTPQKARGYSTSAPPRKDIQVMTHE
jgi:hypothetical protein